MSAKTRDLIVINILAVVAGLVAAGLMMLLLGKNPLTAYGFLFSSVLRDKYTLAEVFVKATPLIFTGLAFAFTFKANLFNIGAQGQFYIGALLAVASSLFLQNRAPAWLALPVVMLLAAIGGGVWGGFIGFVKARFRANEFLVSMMSSYVALAIMNYLLRTVLMEAKGEYPQTDALSKAIWLPTFVARTRLHYGFILAVVVALLIWVVLYKTKFGFRVRVVGNNQEAGRLAGIDTGRIYVSAFFLSGALAGLAGFTEVNGVQHMLIQGFSPDLGAMGIGIAILANANPIGIVFAAILFGLLSVGGNIMGQMAGIPSSVIWLMQGFVMVFVIMAHFLRSRLEIRREKRRLRKAVEA